MQYFEMRLTGSGTADALEIAAITIYADRNKIYDKEFSPQIWLDAGDVLEQTI